MIFLCAFNSAAISQDQLALSKRDMKEVSRIFEGETEVSEVILASSSTGQQELLREGDQVYRIVSGNVTCGYLLSTRAKGRYDYFDYSLFLSQDLVVLNVIITVYRSTHGAAICQKKWLGQFKGYEGEDLKLGDQIDAVSGATLSAESIVEDIRRCHLLMTYLKGEGAID